MNSLIKHITMLLMSAAFLLPATSHALKGGGEAYVGVAVGTGSMIQTGAADETSTGYKLYGGLHAVGPWYVEVGIVNLGSFVNDTVEASTNALHLVGRLPFTASVVALAKVGMHSWDRQNTGSASTTGSDTTYGFAVMWDMPIGYTARIEWEQFSGVGQVDATSGNDMTLVSVGVSLRF